MPWSRFYADAFSSDFRSHNDRGRCNSGKPVEASSRHRYGPGRPRVVQTLDQLAQERSLPEAVVNGIRARYIERLNRAELSDGGEDSRSLIDLYDEIETLLIDTERRHIFGQLERGELIDEARRHIERELDLRETHLQRNIFSAPNHEE
jgi:hypothetical protein